MQPWQGAPVARPSPPTRVTPPPAPAPSFGEPPRRAFDLEEKLGANWLGKLGVILMVLGIALYIAFLWDKIPAIGKVSLGYLSGGGMLGLGVWLEKRERYRVFARGLIGGGWALVFFTTYAMHHVAAAQVIQSQTVDLVLMLLVAGAMVAHTLRYRSQVVTGMAFLLGFTTVTLSHDTVYSLSAGAVLALGLVVLVVRMRWFELEVFGVLASYLNHYLWLRPIVEKMGEQRHPFAEFYPSVALLKDTFKCVTIDPRGFGGSETDTAGGTFDVEAQAEDLHQALLALGLGEVHLIGHGFGSLIAGSCLQNHPQDVRTLTLVNPQKRESNNLIWKYHWTVSNELEKRSESSMARAIELAEQPE